MKSVDTLIGSDLDSWVAKACKLPGRIELDRHRPVAESFFYIAGTDRAFRPSTSWTDGGPIIEREKLELRPVYEGGDFSEWRAFASGDVDGFTGNTVLIAAMRAFVASKFSEVVPG